MTDIYIHYNTSDNKETCSAFNKLDYQNDKDHITCTYDRCGRGNKGGTADNRGEQNGKPECGFRSVSGGIFDVLHSMYAYKYACKIFGKAKIK